ncbi:UNVERIFIED_CONTAM: hypothetical protein K2H54_038081 [Gekko kuhli]
MPSGEGDEQKQKEMQVKGQDIALKDIVLQGMKEGGEGSVIAKRTLYNDKVSSLIGKDREGGREGLEGSSETDVCMVSEGAYRRFWASLRKAIESGMGPLSEFDVIPLFRGPDRGVTRYSGQPPACFQCGGYDHLKEL